MRVVWLVMPNLLYYLPGRPGDGCEAGAAADRAAGSYRRLQCRGMLKRAPRAPPPAAALEAYPPAQGCALWAQGTTGPRRAGAEERLRRRSDACPTSQTSLRFDHPDANGWQQML